MAVRPATTQVAKLTTQLSRGDLITIDGLGAFAVLRSEPYGSQALIKLAWDNLAVIAPRDITWTAVSPATALRGMRRQGHHLRRPRPARPDLGPPGPPLAHPVTPQAPPPSPRGHQGPGTRPVPARPDLEGKQP